jgi:hypothetical protein
VASLGTVLRHSRFDLDCGSVPMTLERCRRNKSKFSSMNGGIKTIAKAYMGKSPRDPMGIERHDRREERSQGSSDCSASRRMLFANQLSRVPLAERGINDNRTAEEGHVMPDHVHMLIHVPPKLAYRAWWDTSRARVRFTWRGAFRFYRRSLTRFLRQGT